MKFLLLFFVALPIFSASPSITGSGSISGAGFITSASTAPSRATTPSPANLATYQPLAVTIGWANGGGASSYDVYAGSTSGSMALVSAGQVGTSYVVTNVIYSQQVHWRIDSSNSVGTTVGDEWAFTIVTPFLADAFVDFEAGSDEATLTTANLSSSTVGSVGAWSFMNGGNSDALIVDVVDAPAIYTAVTVGASTYLGLGTRAIRIDNSKHTNGAVLTLTAPVNNCSAGCFVKCQDNTISGGTQRALDLLAIQGVNDGTSHFVIAQQANSGTKFVAHTENGGSSGVTMSLNTWYWITWKFSKNDKGYVALFNATTGAQVGSTQEFAVGNVQAQSIQFGPTDSHVPIPGDPDSPDTFTLINNLVVSTSGTFPLGP